MLAQPLKIGDQMFGGVVDQASGRRRTAGSALIKQDDAPVLRIKKTAQMRRTTAPGATMQYHHRTTSRVTALLHV